MRDADGCYYYDRNQDEINEELMQQEIAQRINQANEDNAKREEQISIISSFLESIKDSPVYEKAKEFLEKEEEKIDQRKKENANYTRVLFLGAPETNVKKEIWESIYNAMDRNSVIQIEYQKAGRRKKDIYQLQPFQLIFDNGSWDLWARVITNSHQGLKLFNLSRISKVKVLELAGKFFLPKNYSFKNSLRGNFGCYNDENPQTYKIQFAKDSYAWLYSKNRIWGEKQTVSENEDGVLLTFEASQLKPILRWVLGWGDEVKPLEPEELVSEWKEKIKKMAKVK